MEVFTLAALAALVVKVMTVVKSIGKDNNVVVTQVLTWLVGVGVLWLGAQSDVSGGLIFPGTTFALESLDFASIVLAGMALASLGSTVLYDFKKAIDNSDSATEPRLLDNQ